MVMRDGPKACGTVGCSRQGQPMRKRRDDSGIQLDVCSACGCITLDNGELEELLQYAGVVERSLVARQPVPSYQAWDNHRSRQAPTTVVTNNYGGGYNNGFNSGGSLFGNMFGGQDQVFVEPDGDVVIVDRDIFGNVESVTEVDNTPFW